MGSFKYIVWLRGSLDNSKEGASGKKMAAFYVVTCVVTPLCAGWAIWAYKNNKWDLLPEVLGSLLLFSAAALGINGAEKIAENLKKKKDETNTNNPEPEPNADQLPQR